MSLDIAILDDDGTPKRQVSLGINEHVRLLQSTTGNPNSLLLRLKDYYADAEFSYAELDVLTNELGALQENHQSDKALRPILENLIDLAKEAAAERRSLFALAD